MKYLLHYLFIPHHTNNHKPKVIHLDSWLLYLIVFLLFHMAVISVQRVNPQVLGFATDIFADQLLNLTNQKRIDSGLNPLVMNQQLSQAASLKASDMFSYNYWAHNSPEGKTPWDFINSSGYKYTVAGENLAKNFSNSQGVVDAWMASPTHKDNILKPNYQEVGFAIVNGVLNGEETTLVVQMFGASNSIAPVAQKETVQIDKLILSPTPTTKIAAGTSNTNQIVEIPPVATVSGNADQLSDSNLTNQVSQFQPRAVFAADTDQGLSIKPLIDRLTLTKRTSYIFIFLVLIVFILDMIMVNRKKVVRISGHNLAHILFLITILIILFIASPGSVLYE